MTHNTIRKPDGTTLTQVSTRTGGASILQRGTGRCAIVYQTGDQRRTDWAPNLPAAIRRVERWAQRRS